MWYDSILERDLIPDAILRQVIRALIRQRLREEAAHPRPDFVAELQHSPIAINTADANRQHYEVPPEFFTTVLGPHRKYSCCFWADGVTTLEEAERRMLELSSERAGIEDGHRVLDLGCGWGSMSLYLAQKFPHSQITGVSNSRPQREFIEAQARERGITNLSIVTADMNTFAPNGRFERVISIEMFEHMRNYQELLRRIASWLNPEGALFVHIFTHRCYTYPFETKGPGDWMAEHFFTGGIMPSDDLLPKFHQDLTVTGHWRFDGGHYQKTARAWLERMDQNRGHVLQIFAETYGKQEALRWWVRWRVFFLAVEELWGFRNGREWLVSHYLLRPSGVS
jgi:cyclopropane-fatty-acyl-phospholipid synthase